METMEDLGKLFYQDMHEKRVSASGARHKKGKRGKVGRVVTPSDLAGPEYRQGGQTLSYNITDLVGVLSQSPALKDALLARLDEEYRTYRLAIERTVEAVNQLLGAALASTGHRLDQLERRVAALEGTLGEGKPAREPVMAASGQAVGETAEATGPRPARKRIRWGNTPEEIKSTTFRVLEGLQRSGERITVGLIRSRTPSMMRWLYGDKAVFAGLKGLLEEYQQHMAQAASS
ncbi:MAG: hypothetical protein QME93_02880 [Bacillota bacterium]|nr:hypothetical protein [Bacillota bacterium]MDI7248999.1 hypothetical protein [Bacillota bacterium]